MNIINESNKNYNLNKRKLGMMTLPEFLEYTNPSRKVTPENAYTITKLDYNATTREYMRIFNIEYDAISDNYDIAKSVNVFLTQRSSQDKFYIDLENKYIMINNKGMDYLNEANNILDWLYSKHGIKIEEVKVGKYFPSFRFSSTPNRDDTLIQRKTFGKHKVVFYKDMFGITAYSPTDKIKIGAAQNEWGALLVHIIDEARGIGIGEYLIKLAYEHLPELYNSGGYSVAGKNAASRTWASIVSEMLANGDYSDLVRNGDLTLDCVKTIVRSAKEINKAKLKKPKEVKEDPHLLVMLFDTTFILYDTRFFTDLDDGEPNEQYIYGYGFLRTHEPSGESLIYRIDYEEKFKRLSNLIMFQVAKNQGVEITISRSDVLEIGGIPEIIEDNDKARLDRDVIDLKKISKIDTNFRKKNDEYNELTYRLQEMSESKW